MKSINKSFLKISLPHILFEITPECNLDCLYCYNHWKANNHPLNLPVNTYHKSRKVLKKLFSQAEVNHITFTGGEPLLAERFTEVVLYARLKNKSVTVISNGNSASSETYKTLLSLGTALFEFPFHSSRPDIHDQMTGTYGSWQNSLDSIKYVLSNGGRVVPSIIISSINFREIAATIEFLHALGLNRMMLNRINIGGNLLKKGKHLIPQKSHLAEAFKQASEIAGITGLEISSNICIPFCYMDVKQFSNIRFTTCSLDVNLLPLAIDVDGNVRLCNHSPVSIGNIFNTGLGELLKSDYVIKWKNIIPDYCDNCKSYSICLGGCRAASEQIGKGLGFPDPIVEINS